MKVQFLSLLERLGIKNNSEELFIQLSSLYSEKSRFYHNLSHIEHVLCEFKDARELTENPNAVEFALWYHDSIYNPQMKCNEEKSAEFAAEVCKNSGIPLIFANYAKKLILITRHLELPKSFDEKVIVDCDLSILGQPKEVFDEYEKNIRKEYSFVSEEDFRKGRASILQNFLKRKSIYSTELFRQKYESSARKNLERSLARLSV